METTEDLGDIWGEFEDIVDQGSIPVLPTRTASPSTRPLNPKERLAYWLAGGQGVFLASIFIVFVGFDQGLSLLVTLLCGLGLWIIWVRPHAGILPFETTFGDGSVDHDQCFTIECSDESDATRFGLLSRGRGILEPIYRLSHTRRNDRVECLAGDRSRTEPFSCGRPPLEPSAATKTALDPQYGETLASRAPLTELRVHGRRLLHATGVRVGDLAARRKIRVVGLRHP